MIILYYNVISYYLMISKVFTTASKRQYTPTSCLWYYNLSGKICATVLSHFKFHKQLYSSAYTNVEDEV